MPTKVKILVTNDDGIYAEGLKALAKALQELGEVWIVAPDREQSASSHAITLHRPLRVTEVGPQWLAVDGTPADCVNLAVNGLLGFKPDLIVSGINRGGNLVDDVTYSGTVSAAMEGTLLGIPSFAVSLVGRENLNYEPAARFAVRLADVILKKGLPQPLVFLNVNVPNVKDMGEIKGVAVTVQGRRKYGEAVVEKIDPRGRKYYWIGGDELGFEYIENSDIVMVLKKYISITPLHLDLTHYPSLKAIEGWKNELERF